MKFFRFLESLSATCKAAENEKYINDVLFVNSILKKNDNVYSKTSGKWKIVAGNSIPGIPKFTELLLTARMATSNGTFEVEVSSPSNLGEKFTLFYEKESGDFFVKYVSWIGVSRKTLIRELEELDKTESFVNNVHRSVQKVNSQTIIRQKNEAFFANKAAVEEAAKAANKAANKAAAEAVAEAVAKSAAEAVAKSAAEYATLMQRFSNLCIEK
jgi:ribosomal protein L18